MKVLVVTPLLRDAVTQRTALYGRPLQSIFNLRHTTRLDHYLPNGGDTGKGNVNVTAKFALARVMMLEGDWDYMLTAESDMLVPPDGLEKLLALDVDIAYGLYAFRHRVRWNAAVSLTEQHMVGLDEDPARARALWGEPIETAGLGNGFTLIKRHVLEALPFRCWRGVAQDWALACDAVDAGFTQVCHTGVVCGHMTLTPSPRIYWPDVNEPNLVRTEFLA